jgi:FkbH-like protein
MKSEIREQLDSVRDLIQKEEYHPAFALLCEITKGEDDFSVQHRLAKVFDSVPEGSLNLTPIRIALVPTSTVDHFSSILKFWLAREGFEATVYIAEFDTMHQSILDPQSELYSFKPDIVWLFSNYRDIRINSCLETSPQSVQAGIRSAVDDFISLWENLKRNSTAYIIQNNADIPLIRAFGNYDGVMSWGLANMLREFNVALARSITTGVTIFDLDFTSSLYGKRQWFDERYWYHSKHAFSLDASGLVAFQAARLIRGIKGLAKKCVVLDLDNTLWGGVIGDDGLEGIRLGNGADGEAYVDFQKYLLQLKNRGIILTVCSKNDEDNAKLPFMKHPDMKLTLGDIAVFTANWENKADNIRSIADTLGIGLDSLVFIDDNPAERALIRKELPMVSVPEMPEDPVLYVRTLDQQHFFETISFSDEDRSRSDMYRENAERKQAEKRFTNISEFLNSLQMQASVHEFDSLNLARTAQLINKSNQFHLTTTRYSEAQIMKFAQDPNVVCRFFKMKDCFGDNGLISVVILKKQGPDLIVDTWVMSCRVLSRGMEEFVHNEIVAIGKKIGCRRLLGTYIPTSKNKLVANLYKKLGYSLAEEKNGTTHWEIGIDGDADLKENYIQKVENF